MTEIILTSSVLILLLAILRRALRGRIDPRVQYALWLLAAVRLLTPGTLFTAPVSVVGAAEGLQTSLHEAFPASNAFPEPAAGNIPAQPQPSAPLHAEQTDWDAIENYVAGYPGAAPETVLENVSRSGIRLDAIWKTGIAVTGGAMALSNFVFYHRLRKNRKILALPAACWAGGLPVYEAEDLPSPCLFGLFRPAIYLNGPAMRAERPAHILAHEFAHYRHGDHLWSILRCVCVAVHWYNPLVWWAAALSRRDCELACDASALRRLGEAERIGYGQTLLGMVSQNRRPAALFQTATTMTAGKRTMTERIALIIRQPRARKSTLALAALLVCGLAACTFGGAAEAGLADLMEYPGLHWNDTPEAVMDALGITSENFLSTARENGETHQTWEFVVENPESVPAAQYAIFHFSQYFGTGHSLGLDQVILCYPDGMEDFDALREELVRQYGPGTEQDSAPYTAKIIADSLEDQHAKREIDAILGGNAALWEEIQARSGPHCFSWDAGLDVLPEAQADAFAKFYQAHDGQYSYPGLYAEFAPDFPAMVRVSWEDNSLYHYTFNEITYDAREYVAFLQPTSPAAQPLDTSTAFLTGFPGLHWNDTPQAVMETLGITEEDFIESDANNSGSGNIWSFVIGDYPLYGHTAQYVIFDFTQYVGTGSELGLYNIRVCYPDDMEDFDAVREDLFRQFGPYTEVSYQVTQLAGSWQTLLGDRYGRWAELQQQPGIKSMSWQAVPDAQTAEMVRSAKEAYPSYVAAAQETTQERGNVTIYSKVSTPTFEQFFNAFTGANLTWSCNSWANPTFNVLTFSGSEYVLLRQLFSGPTREIRSARIVVNGVREDLDPRQWLRCMDRLDWANVRQAAADAGLDAAETEQRIIDAVYQCIDQRGSDMTQQEYVSILTATAGLTGTPKEGGYQWRSDISLDEMPLRYGDIVCRLYAANPGQFAEVVLETLPEEYRNEILDFFRYEAGIPMAWNHQPFDGKQAPSREEAVHELEADLAVSRSLPINEIVFHGAGESAQYRFVNVSGSGAASFESQDPEIATVDRIGLIVAIAPGETDINIHYEGDGVQRDLVCHVRCEW